MLVRVQRHLPSGTGIGPASVADGQRVEGSVKGVGRAIWLTKGDMIHGLVFRLAALPHGVDGQKPRKLMLCGGSPTTMALGHACLQFPQRRH